MYQLGYTHTHTHTHVLYDYWFNQKSNSIIKLL